MSFRKIGSFPPLLALLLARLYREPRPPPCRLPPSLLVTELRRQPLSRQPPLPPQPPPHSLSAPRAPSSSKTIKSGSCAKTAPTPLTYLRALAAFARRGISPQSAMLLSIFLLWPFCSRLEIRWGPVWVVAGRSAPAPRRCARARVCPRRGRGGSRRRTSPLGLRRETG